MQILALGRKFLYIIALIAVAFSFGSCGNTRNLTYLQGQFDTAKLSQLNAAEPIIRKGDLLSIIVFSDNPEATKIYNQLVIATSTSNSGASQGINGSSPSAPGYLVDDNGNIIFQGLGLIHVEGLTKAQLHDTLDSRFKEFLKNPYYSIRFLNYKLTMLGEVNRPGVINIPGERINLLEAIALSGDMTLYGRRDNILIIRENNGKREFGRLNLLKPESMLSPYFYLQQNDLVFIEATNKKVTANDQVTARNISLGLAFISTAVLLYSVFVLQKK